MRKQIRCISYCLMCISMVIALTCCSNNPSQSQKLSESDQTLNTDIHMEAQTNPPKSTEYTVEFIDQNCYIILEDLEYYKNASLVYFDQLLIRGATGYGISNMRSRLLSGELDEYAKRFLARNADENGRIKLCDFNELYIPILPEDLRVLSIEVFSENDYQYRITNIESETFDRGMAEFSSKDYTENKDLVSDWEKLSFSDGTKNIEVFYTQVEDDIAFHVFVNESGAFYHYEDRATRLPTDDWFLSFGIEKYIPT